MKSGSVVWLAVAVVGGIVLLEALAVFLASAMPYLAVLFAMAVIGRVVWFYTGGQR